ncbi:MAG: hypothetical protein IK082_01775 [Oscillospiraceae bacterium]|nr:hypothetical protein [Oscillospiraceae bacterium]
MKRSQLFCIIIVIACVLLVLVSCSGCGNTMVVGVRIDYSPYLDSPAASIRQLIVPPSAWQDEKLTVSAPRVRYKTEDGHYTYADEWQDGVFYYEFECRAGLKTLYIRAPEVNVARPSEEYTVPAEEGAVIMKDGSPWITVGEVRVTAGELVISCTVEGEQAEIWPFVNGERAAGNVTGHQRESGKMLFDETIRVTYPDGIPIDPADVCLSITRIETIHAVDAIYTTDADVTLVPVGG